MNTTITAFQRMFLPGASNPPPPPPPQDVPTANYHRVRSRYRPPRNEPIPIPFAWATNRRAKIHTLNHLLHKGIFNITGDVKCKSCQREFQISFDLMAKFDVISQYFITNMNNMRDRAPAIWMHPTLPRCVHCGQENSVKPVIAKKKKNINWLFLLLGQMLGCCKLEQLKYFCKYNNHHRTGAKNRVLYLTYLDLCKQLDPTGPFDVAR
ncbi:hypothetical protein TSUD_127080 [Trifolium subterraneum]|nr:hypothetical protein TSUD_127080 [Trifolium subterraneum]